MTNAIVDHYNEDARARLAQEQADREAAQKAKIQESIEARMKERETDTQETAADDS